MLPRRSRHPTHNATGAQRGNSRTAVSSPSSIRLSCSASADALHVIRVLPDSGAFDAGVGYGDRIIAVDGVPVVPLGSSRTPERDLPDDWLTSRGHFSRAVRVIFASVEGPPAALLAARAS